MRELWTGRQENRGYQSSASTDGENIKSDFSGAQCPPVGNKACEEQMKYNVGKHLRTMNRCELSSDIYWRLWDISTEPKTGDVLIDITWVFPGGSVVMNPPANAKDPGSILGLGRYPGEGNGNPL